MLKKFMPCWMGITLMLTSCGAIARQYAIELIVFERTETHLEHSENDSASADFNEQWDFSSTRMATRWRRMAQLANQASTQQNLESVIHLKAAQIKLREAGYRIVESVGWQQPRSSYQHAPLIPLGETATTNPIASFNTSQLTGFVRIYTTALIYADVDLQLSPPWAGGAVASSPEKATTDSTAHNSVSVADTHSEVDTSTTQRPHYFISEKRRLKFKQIHYFDHPFFGALLVVWPVDDAPA